MISRPQCVRREREAETMPIMPLVTAVKKTLESPLDCKDLFFTPGSVSPGLSGYGGVIRQHGSSGSGLRASQNRHD